MTVPPTESGKGNPGQVTRIAEEFIRLHEAGQLKDLDEFCARYPENQRDQVRQECEQLLRIQGVIKQHDQLAAGQMLGSYEIVEPIGKGGMGEVYKAKDADLDRDIAIKVLPPELACQPERVKRFKREAKAIAALDHPNIVTIHTVEESNGLHFITMQLVQGKMLSELIPKKGLPLDKFFDLAIPLADAISSAHEQGVTHRDLKPANIMVTADGRVEILDFGLAKLRPQVTAEGPTQLPLSSLTVEGQIVGTVAYMSPEQAEGREVDNRTDIFSLGIILYEMVTGQRPFKGESRVALMSSIMKDTPTAVRDLNPRIPIHLGRIIRRCLERDCEQRFQTSKDLRNELSNLRREIDSGLMEASPESDLIAAHVSGTKTRTWAAALILAALGIGALAGSFWAEGSSASTPSTIRTQQLTDRVGMEETPAISPDGSQVVFVAPVNGVKQIWLRLRDKGAPVPLTDYSADHAFPRWADDNTVLYFRRPEKPGTPGSLWESAVVGPTPQSVAPAHGEADVSRSTQRIATFRNDPEEPVLVIMDRDGNEPEELRLPVGTYRSPRWSPDGQRLTFQVQYDLSRTQIQVMELPEGETEIVVEAAQMRGMSWLPDGSGLVYASSEGSTLPYPPTFSLWRVNTDGSGKVQLSVGDAGYVSYVEPDVTLGDQVAGQVVASRVHQESDIFRYPVNGSPVENVMNELRITDQTAQVQTPSVSPSGDEVVYLSNSGGHANLWIARVDRSREPRQLTFESDPSIVIGIPVWNPKRDVIVYYKRLAGTVDAEQWLINPDGIGGRKLVEKCIGGAAWSPDGEWLYYFASDNDGKKCTFKVHVDGGETVLVRHEAAGMSVTFDGNTGYYSPSNQRAGDMWRITPVETGTPEPFVNLESRIPLWPHHFHLSSDDLWLATPLTDGETTNLYKISTRDRSILPITDFQQRRTMIARQVSWQQGGEYIFAAVLETDADIVLLDGALR